MPDTMTQTTAFQESRAFLAKHGYPTGDIWERPSGQGRFADGLTALNGKGTFWKKKSPIDRSAMPGTVL